MYYLTFIFDSAMLADSTKIGAIRSVFKESTYKWLENDSLANNEKERIIKRFHSEIVNKLEKIKRTKSYDEK